MFEANRKAFVFVIAALSFAQACQINVLSPIPLFSKVFGTKNLTFRAKPSGVVLSENESIDVYCSSGIKYDPSRYVVDNVRLQKKALILCQNDRIVVRDQYENGYYNSITVYCSTSTSSQIYESINALSNCNNFMSYAIGEHIPLLGTVIKSAICYDLESFTLKYVNYIAYQRNDIWISSEPNLSNELGVDLGIEVGNLENYFDFMSQYNFNLSRDAMRLHSNQFFDAFEFDYDSILQDEYFHNKLEDFAYIFNTMWWRQLRQNNWHFFLSALKERTYSEKYIVFVGTHGNATMPPYENPDGNPEEVTVRWPNLAVTAPKYIWAYVKPVIPNSEEEFVVIATNSPYVETPDHTELCERDICDDIGWLKESRFGHLRRIPTFGYTFCCQVAEVAMIVEHFPASTKGLKTTTAALPSPSTAAQLL